jgi:aminopeptidase 2
MLFRLVGRGSGRFVQNRFRQFHLGRAGSEFFSGKGFSGLMAATPMRPIPSQTPLSFVRSYCSRLRHLPDMSSSTNHQQRELLPADVKPVHYDVQLDPDLENFTYEGIMAVHLDVQENTNYIVLNALDLEVRSASLDGGQHSGAEPMEINIDNDAQTVQFKFAGLLKQGEKIVLNIRFAGTLNDKLCGFYRSVHTDENGKKRVVATTQMEPTDCRRAFPCFDEPALKATFDISLVHHKDMTALSNMDVKEVVDVTNDRQVTKFNTTPVMSTYLVAFIVGDLSYVESNYFRVPVRVYATPGLENKGMFSAELGAKTLEFFEKKFGVEYPLPKMDMVAIHDFSAGAMENWGLVTYRVVDVLFDEEKDNASTKQRVAEVVQHELAHQWFGNLVTMDWWEGLWLNEGFATWMSWYSCNQFFPEWRVWESYVGDNLQQCLGMDGLRSSHPVEVPVKRADEINEIFDAISYAKGSTVIKMISQYLGEETFIKGISAYLKKHKYGNTTTEDLTSALSEVSGKDVSKLMNTWTKKVGFPLLTVAENQSDIQIRQNRYLTTGDVKPEEDQTIYPLDLAIKTEEGVHNQIMEERSTTIKVNNPEFYKLNAEQGGIYRVLYPTDRVEKLSKAGTEGLLSAEDKVGIVADTGALSVSGYQRTSDLLTLVYNWKNESSPTVWNEMLARLQNVIGTWKLQPQPVKDALLKVEHEVAVPKAKELGWTFGPNDGLLDAQLKSDLFSAAVHSKDQEFIDLALGMFKEYVGGSEKAIHPNLRRAVFSAAAKYGDSSVWDKLLALYRDPEASAAGVMALSSLGKNPSMEVKKKTLDLAFGGIRSQDIFYLLRGVQDDAEGCQCLWEWLQENWDKAVEAYPAGLGMLSSIVSIVCSGLTTQEQYDSVIKFFENKSTKGFDQALSMSKDRLQSKIAWVNRDAENVEEWLKAQKFL